MNATQLHPSVQTVNLPGNRKAVFVRTNRVQQPVVRFTGDTASGFGKFKPLALGALVASLFAVPIGLMAQQPAPQPPAQPKKVQTVHDIPGLANLKSPLLVVEGNSVISKDAQQKLIDTLNQFNKGTHGQIAVVEISDTSRDNLGDLATEIFNELKIGQEGKNDGMLLLINNAGLRQGVRGKQMFIKPGHGLKDKMTADMATKMLTKYAVPHLEEGRKTGNFDKAVLNTVEALKEFMEKGETSEIKPARGLTQEEKILIGILIAVVLILIIAAIASKGSCCVVVPCDSSGGNWSSGGSSEGCSGGDFGGGFSSGGGGGI